jgi:hypothetical protein
VPEDRLIHPRYLDSSKVSILSLLERVVWIDMIMLADDFGVLPNRPSWLRENDRGLLASSTPEEVQKAVETVARIGLFLPFDHQSQEYLVDPRWQDFQKVERPRRTYRPIPAPEILVRCSVGTAWLFVTHHPAAASISLPESLVNDCRRYGRDRRVGHQSIAGKRLTANGRRQSASGKEGKKESEKEREPELVPAWGTPEAFAGLWNAEAPEELAKIQDITPGRRRLIQAALRIKPERGYWLEVMAKIRSSEWLRGLKPSPGHEQWKADLDFVLSEKKGTPRYIAIHERAEPTSRSKVSELGPGMGGFLSFAERGESK